MQRSLRVLTGIGLLTACFAAVSFSASPAEQAITVVEVESGLELLSVKLPQDPSLCTDTLVIVRVDPARLTLRLLSRSELTMTSNLSAADWVGKQGLLLAANAGMYADDFLTHVGYMRAGVHVNSRSRNKYLSVAAFGPKSDSLPPFHIFDLDEDSLEEIVANYSCVIQNLRLIKRPAENRWEQQDRRWSEMALAEDSLGRALFVFSAAPMSMHDFNDLLLSLPLGVIAAQHLEGGPEAQLALRTEHYQFQMVGSFETGFWEDCGNDKAWPIPNVIGITR